MTTVVNIKTGEPFDIYVGRATTSPKGVFPQSIYANPFPIKADTTEERRRALLAYRGRMIRDHALMRRVHELRGLRLACWCHPKPCHAHFLAALADSTVLHGTECPACAKTGRGGKLQSTPFLRSDPDLIQEYARCDRCGFYTFAPGKVWRPPEISQSMLPGQI